MKTNLRTTRILTALAAMALAGAWLNGSEVKAAMPDNEAALIEILQTAPKPDKALACKKLVTCGTAKSVPELANLLPDPELSSWARIALEAIPDRAADQALWHAAQDLKGELLIGVVNSIGVRRDAEAVDLLASRLRDSDINVACAAATSLGHIGNEPATVALRRVLSDFESNPKLQSAAAQGCLFCAERQMADGNRNNAIEIYQQIRFADVPVQRVIEAIRGEILARGEGGIPLLVEQLRSPDKKFFRLGLTVARQLQAPGIGEALAAELGTASPERAALLLHALADRAEHSVPPAVVEAARSGAKPLRIAAIEFIGRRGDASSLAALLESATDEDSEISDAAKAALGSLSGKRINAEIAERMNRASGESLPILIELVGQRRISATPALVDALNNRKAAIRLAALAALGNTIEPDRLNILIVQVLSPREGEEAAAKKALMTASIRMPDRDACAAELAAALAHAPDSAKPALLEILGAVQGQRALAAINRAMKDGDPKLEDVGTRMLGSWMSVDAAPVLLDIAKNPRDEYQLRAMHGYIRLARQFAVSPKQRAEMCQTALDIAKRPDERKLVLNVLAGYPSVETLAVALKAWQDPAMKRDAQAAIVKMARKLVGRSAETQEMLARSGIELPRVEIIKAEYGAGTEVKDVTDLLQGRANFTPRIELPSASYNESFGGDPALNVPKQLKVRYRINGKEGEATFDENAPIDLPLPR